MSQWINVNDKLPPDATQGVWDSKPYLVLINDPYRTVSENSIRTETWMNNRWVRFPSGATKVTHWMPLPDLPDTKTGANSCQTEDIQ